MMPIVRGIGFTVLGLLLQPAAVAPQTEVALEMGASRVGPAAGLDLDDAHYVMAGLRVSHHTANGGGLFASLLSGHSVGDSLGGRFVSAVAQSSMVDEWGPRWAGAFDLTLLGFEIRNPFPYRTLAVEMEPSIRYREAGVAFETGLAVGIGHSRVELWRRLGGESRIFDDRHWRVGATAELLVGSPSAQVGIAGGTHDASGARYHSIGGRLVFAVGSGVVELRGDRWSTPLGPETTGGLTLSLPLSGPWRFRGFFGRSDPDPLTMAQPGSGSGGGLIGWTAYSTEPARREPAFQVLEHSERGQRIRLVLDAPEAARRVAVVGDFTLWEPVAMRREGDRWVAEVDVAVGTHHFGFLVDDEWYLPDDAPDVVPDEWGRASATLVIEGAGR